MKWTCSACGNELSDCKIYCSCGKIRDKYANLVEPPKTSKWNCFKNSFDNYFDDIEDWSKLIAKVLIIIGAFLLSWHYFGIFLTATVFATVLVALFMLYGWANCMCC